MAVHSTSTEGGDSTAPSIVLLHANGGDHRDFDAVLPALRAGGAVHAIDWPGHGASDSDPAPSAVRFAERLPSVLEQLDGAPFVLVGSSVGGFAAARVAARRPDLVRALVLVDPGGFTPNWLGTRLACKAIGSRLLAARMMRVLPRVYLRHHTDQVVVLRRRAVAASLQPEAVRTFAAVWRSFAARDHDLRADAAAIACPVLLAWGRRDPVLPWRVDGRRARRSLPGAEIVTFACGHQPFAEMPAEFLTAFGGFLDRLRDDGTVR